MMNTFRITAPGMTPHLLKAVSLASLKRRLAKDPVYKDEKKISVIPWSECRITARELAKQLQQFPAGTFVVVPSAGGTINANHRLNSVHGLTQTRVVAQSWSPSKRKNVEVSFNAVCLESTVRSTTAN